MSSKLDAMATHNMLETQISQVAQQQATIAALVGTFPGQAQPNPKGHANVITLRSGTELDEPIDPRLQNLSMYQNSGKGTEKINEPKINDKNDKSEEATEKETPYVPLPLYKPPIPFPQRLAESKNEGQFKKFIKLLKHLNITIPFTEVITQIPSYAKFLKEILSNKKKLEENGTVMLTAECSAILQNNMPPKLKDPGSFSIPSVIEKFVIDNGLCDLFASVSLMPLSTCKKLNLGELRPTKMSLKLMDRSVKHLIGMLENVPVRVGQFYIPTDFVIMDIKEDWNIPITLGRPFLATSGAIIDVKKGKLTFEVSEEKVEFILAQFLKAPGIDDSCCLLDVIDEYIKEMEMQPSEYIDALKIPSPPIFEDDNWKEPFVDDSLRECQALRPDPMPFPKKPSIT
ncbi:uncharacterized protein LOC131639655 [Vicia villosa]|uniref:uncharacterized protein LOC131639655 n=1 Tax=Vicia villosa TaxID=3911 RepID=UPI00273B491B|nr:uncharacterized protein LOC131639655 [Vicia villosa]